MPILIIFIGEVDGKKMNTMLVNVYGSRKEWLLMLTKIGVEFRMSYLISKK